MKIAIINYGMGNPTSVQNALAFIGHEGVIVADPFLLKDHTKFILPGVGAFGPAMDNLRKSGLKEALHEEIMAKRKPLLGLCLGMQLFFSDSNENGMHAGLNWIQGHVKHIQELAPGVRVPHMGWNAVRASENSRLLANIPSGEHVFYFVHSYACFCSDAADSKGRVDHGVAFDVVIEKDNLFGCQFHPEKSQQSGLQVLKNFAAL